MQPPSLSLMTSLARALQTPLSAASRPSLTSTCQTTVLKNRIPSSCCSASNQIQRAPFSSTASQLARQQKRAKTDRRITLIRYHLNHPATLAPRPLRLSRTRTLRHWTIHRAWQLYQRNLKASRQVSLSRQWSAMRDACEELRVGVGDGGRLFRMAMMKSGVFGVGGDGKGGGGGGVPMEYSKGMVEWVGRVDSMGVVGKGVWDAEWKR